MILIEHGANFNSAPLAKTIDIKLVILYKY